MSSFTRALIVEDLNNGTFKVFEPFKYYVGSLGSENSITVPKGFTFDMFSIPPIARWLLPKVQKKGNQGACIHDLLCKYKGSLPDGMWEGKQYYTSKEAHDVFLEALEVLEVDWFTRNLMHKMVSIFGPRW